MSTHLKSSRIMVVPDYFFCFSILMSSLIWHMFDCVYISHPLISAFQNCMEIFQIIANKENCWIKIHLREGYIGKNSLLSR